MRAKLRFLNQIDTGRRLRKRDLIHLGETLEFLSAYPDNPAVLRSVKGLIPRLSPTDVVYEYSYGVVRRLLEIAPDVLEIHWDGLDDTRR